MLQQLFPGSPANIPPGNRVKRCRVSPRNRRGREVDLPRRPQAGLYAVARGHRILWSPHNAG
jgi:hypothetical protein